MNEAAFTDYLTDEGVPPDVVPDIVYEVFHTFLSSEDVDKAYQAADHAAGCVENMGFALTSMLQELETMKIELEAAVKATDDAVKLLQ